MIVDTQLRMMTQFWMSRYYEISKKTLFKKLTVLSKSIYNSSGVMLFISFLN